MTSMISGCKTLFRFSVLILVGAMLGLSVGCATRRYQPVEEIQHIGPSPQGEAYAHYLKALSYLHDNNADKATTELEEVLRLDPTAARAATALATLYKINHQQDKAISLLERVAAAGADTPNLSMILASLYSSAGRAEDAVAVLEKAVKSESATPSLHMMLAAMYQQMSRLHDAEQEFRRAAEMAPDNPAPYLYLGNLFAANNDLVAALDAYKQASSTRPKSAIIHQKLGQTYTLMHRYGMAVDELRRAAELDPGIADQNAYNLGLVLIEKGDLDQAERPLLVALGRNSRAVNVRRSLAGLYCRMKRWDDADKQYEAISTLNPNDSRFLVERAVLRFVAERYTEVIETLKPLGNEFADDPCVRFLNAAAEWRLGQKDTALNQVKELPEIQDRAQLDSLLATAELFGAQQIADRFASLAAEFSDAGVDSAAAYIFVGRLLDAADRHEKAYTYMVKAAEISPSNTIAHFFAGAIGAELDYKDESIAHLCRALELAPDDPEINNHLGYTYADLDIHLDEAHAMLLKSLKAEPDNGYFLDSMGWVLYRKGQFEQALDYIRRALPNMNTDDAVVRDHLGDVLDALGRTNEAVVEWQKALVLDPTMKSVRKKLDSHSAATTSDTPQ